MKKEDFDSERYRCGWFHTIALDFGKEDVFTVLSVVVIFKLDQKIVIVLNALIVRYSMNHNGKDITL